MAAGSAVCGRCARKLQHLRIDWHRSLRSLCTASSTSSSDEADDEISGEIQSLFTSHPTKRDPMAVLKALASTVKPNRSLPRPEFIEDNFLLPRANALQAECLLAKKSGEEAAKYVISKCPEIFPLRKPNPVWEADDVVIDNVQTEDQLKSIIKAQEARKAVQAYEMLKEQGVEVSLETQNDLLDLAAQLLGKMSAAETLEPVQDDVSHFLTIESKEETADNAEEDTEETDEESDDNEQVDEVTGENLGRILWKKGNYAEQLFESMATKDGRTYEAMVLGLLKHRSWLEAYEFFEKMKATGHQASVLTYNQMFMGISRCFEMEDKWEKTQNLVKFMGEEPIVLPTVQTFNSLIRISVQSPSKDKTSTELALGLFRDMLALGMEPTLDSYNQILRAEYTPAWELKKINSKKASGEKNARVIANPAVLNMVITHIESLPKLPPLEDIEDSLFFRAAMSAAFLCADANLAIRIYNLLNKQNNAAFLGERHSPFYSAFLLTLTTAEVGFPLLLQYYKELVPDKLRPKEHVYTSLFNMISRMQIPREAPKLYEDMRAYRVSLSQPVAVALFRALSVAQTPEEYKLNLDVMVDVLHWMNIFNIEVNPFIISTFINMNCLNDNLQEAWRALDMFEKIRATPSFSSISYILQLATKKMDQFKVVKCIEMFGKFGYSVNKRKRLHIYNMASLHPTERKRLDELFEDPDDLEQRRRKYQTGRKSKEETGPKTSTLDS